jgi:hypothetical protein
LASLKNWHGQSCKLMNNPYNKEKNFLYATLVNP